MAVDWFRFSAAMIAVGFQMALFSLSNNKMKGDGDTVEALVISGFVAYVFAFMCVLADQFGGFTRHRVGSVTVILLALAAGILPMAGLGIFLDGDLSGLDNDKYSATLLCGSAILAVLGGLFSFLGTLNC